MKRWVFVVFLLGLFFPWGLLWGEEENVLVVRTKEAEYDEKSGKITAHDAVLSWKDLVVFCPLLEVDVKAQEVRTQGKVEVTFGVFKAHAEGLLYTRTTNILHVLSFSGEAEGLAFSAQEGLFDFGKGVAVFSGNPVLSLRGLVMSLDEAEYVFATRTWRGKGVRMSREGWSGRAKTASYTEGTNLLVLEGEAEVSREGNRLRGERMTVNLDTFQVRVEGNVEIFLLPPGEKP